jgi:DNA adenine methylase
MSERIRPPLKYFGGKAYLAKYIHELAPPHLHRVILCAGGAQELWHWDPTNTSEVLNDVDDFLTNFYEVLQSEDNFPHFARMVSVVPFSETEWENAHALLAAARSAIILDPTEGMRVRLAAMFFVNCRMSMMGAGKSFTPTTKTRTRAGMNGEVSAWLSCVEGLPAVHQRLRRVLIRNTDAVRCIEKEDGPTTLFYADPPYLHETRSATDVYDFEMNELQHRRLLEALCNARGKAMISGYDNKVYREYLSDWERNAIIRPNNAQKAEEKRPMEEIIWVKR